MRCDFRIFLTGCIFILLIVGIVVFGYVYAQKPSCPFDTQIETNTSMMISDEMEENEISVSIGGFGEDVLPLSTLEEQKEVLEKDLENIQSQLDEITISIAAAEGKCSDLEKEKQSVCEESVETVNDERFFLEAMKTKDLEFCQKINDSDRNSNCIETINEIDMRLIFQDALVKKDISVCETISDPDQNKKCKILYYNEMDQQVLLTIIEKKDLKGCSDLNLKENQKECTESLYAIRDMMLYEQAIQRGEQSYCEKIRGKQEKDDCFQYFEDVKE